MRSCPWCNNPETRTVETKDGFRRVCDSGACDAMGPRAETPEEAERLWNKRPRY